MASFEPTQPHGEREQTINLVYASAIMFACEVLSVDCLDSTMVIVECL